MGYWHDKSEIFRENVNKHWMFLCLDENIAK